MPAYGVVVVAGKQVITLIRHEQYEQLAKVKKMIEKEPEVQLVLKPRRAALKK